jgi:hypothetical protein
MVCWFGPAEVTVLHTKAAGEAEDELRLSIRQILRFEDWVCTSILVSRFKNPGSFILTTALA